MSYPKDLIKLDTSPLTPEMVALAEKELRETPERVKEATDILRKLLRDDPTLHYRDDDEFLIRFLRPTKFYPESALALMRRAAEFKQKHAVHVNNLMPKDEESSFVDNGVVNVLVDKDQKNRRILIVNAGGVWDPSRVSADQIFRMFYLIHQGAMSEPVSQVCGVVVIMDFDGLSMKQDAMPLRLKEVHIVNQPFLFNMVWTMFKPFIREKLKKRMFFHGKKMEGLHQYIDPEYLPEDFGGTKPKIAYSSADWYPVLRSIDTAIEEWNTFGFVEKK